jgi:hypothetical protein
MPCPLTSALLDCSRERLKSAILDPHPAHPHPYRQILPLDVARANPIPLGEAHHTEGNRLDDLWRTISLLAITRNQHTRWKTHARSSLAGLVHYRLVRQKTLKGWLTIVEKKIARFATHPAKQKENAE